MSKENQNEHVTLKDNYVVIGQLSGGASDLIVSDITASPKHAGDYAKQLVKKINAISDKGAGIKVKMKKPWISHDSHAAEHVLIAQIKVINKSQGAIQDFLVEKAIYEEFANNCIYAHLHHVVRLDSKYDMDELQKIKIKIKIGPYSASIKRKSSEDYNCKN